MELSNEIQHIRVTFSKDLVSVLSSFVYTIDILFFSRRFIYLQINKKYLQKKRKTDIRNTVRKIVDKQKQKVWQP